MKTKLWLSLIAVAALISVPMQSEAQGKKSYKTTGQSSGDVEYNATERSPTLPLVQSPPPQNSPNSVVVGAPSYYYYSYPPMGGGYGGGYYGGGNYYGNTPQAGAAFYNVNGNTGRTFWATTPIPGQFSPYGGGFGGPGYGGGYGPGYGGGYGPGLGGYGTGFLPYGGNIGFTP